MVEMEEKTSSISFFESLMKLKQLQPSAHSTIVLLQTMGDMAGDHEIEQEWQTRNPVSQDGECSDTAIDRTPSLLIQLKSVSAVLETALLFEGAFQTLQARTLLEG